MYFFRIDQNDILGYYTFEDSNGNTIPELTDNNLGTYIEQQDTFECLFNNDYPYSLVGGGSAGEQPLFKLTANYPVSGRYCDIYFSITMNNGSTWTDIYNTTTQNIFTTATNKEWSEEYMSLVSGCYGIRIKVSGVLGTDLIPRLKQMEFQPIAEEVSGTYKKSNSFLEVSQYDYYGKLEAGSAAFDDYEIQKEVYIHSYDYNMTGTPTPFFIKNTTSGTTIYDVEAYIPVVGSGIDPNFSDEFLISLDAITWKNPGEKLTIGNISPSGLKTMYVKSNFITGSHLYDTVTNTFYSRLVVEGDMDV